MASANEGFRGTTVICVRRDGKVVMAGDGQVSHGNTILKKGARKVRRLHDDKVLTGFAGSTADAFTLFERFEGRLKELKSNLTRASVKLAQEWRTDKALRRLDALLLVADGEKTFLITGSGDVIEPDEGVIAIGSGGPFAQAAAIALLKHTSLSAREIAETAMETAAGICVYTNETVTLEELG
ncbi:MAG: ATP-dependent protease subunit HslV [Deltaproteobacteria bacterium]|nr:ATP-dependent protease subunit HslV [Deltaproteobacteria bacterium]